MHLVASRMLGPNSGRYRRSVRTILRRSSAAESLNCCHRAAESRSSSSSTEWMARICLHPTVQLSYSGISQAEKVHQQIDQSSRFCVTYHLRQCHRQIYCGMTKDRPLGADVWLCSRGKGLSVTNPTWYFSRLRPCQTKPLQCL